MALAVEVAFSYTVRHARHARHARHERRASRARMRTSSPISVPPAHNRHARAAAAAALAQSLDRPHAVWRRRCGVAEADEAAAIVFSPGRGGRRRYIGGVEGSIPLPGPPRWGSRPPRTLRGIGLGRSRPAHVVRRKRAVAAAAATAAAAPTDDARGGALTRPTSLCAAHAASSRAPFVSISPPSRARRSLAWSLSRSHVRSRRAVTVAAAAAAAATDDARDGVRNEAPKVRPLVS